MPQTTSTNTVLADSAADRRRILAERLLAQRRQQPAVSTSGPRARPEPETPAPLSFAQERLWLADKLATHPEQFSVPMALRVTGTLDAELLHAAFISVAARHEVLRTRYLASSDGPVQVVSPVATVDFAAVDLSPSSEAERLAAIVAAADHRYDLSTEPPLRVRLFRCGPSEAVVVLTVHHIACDSWSIGLLFDEVRECYAAAVEGREPDLPALPVQYADYAVWQRTHLHSERLRELVTHWAATLAGAPFVLELPFDRPRAGQRRSVGSFYRTELDAGLAARVRAVAKEARVTPFTVLLALYRVLLARHAGVRDLLIGVPATGRGLPEVDRLIGCFLNMMVVRGAVDAGTVRELIAQEHRQVLDAFAHEVPFERLVEELRPARGGSATPLFQTTFSYRPDAPDLPDLGQARVTPFELPGGVAQYDLALDLVSGAEGGMSAVWAYDDDLLDEATVAGFAARYLALVEAAVADLDGPVDTLPVVTAVERAALLSAGTATTGAAPDAPDLNPYRDICDAVWSIAAHTPDAPAVSDGSGVRDYAWLTGYADRLAAYLQAHGVGPDDRVGVLLERRAELPAVLLAVARTGAAWVPLDPTHPEDRLSHILADSAARVLITGGGAAPASDSISTQVVDIDADAKLIAGCHAPRPVVSAPERTAYLIYTSGSTGRPKGVAISHAAFARLIAAMRGRLRSGPGTRLVAVSTVAFDVAQLELMLPLVCGGQVYVTTSAQVTDPVALAGLIDEWRPTVVHATPSIWRLLSQLDWKPDRRIQVLCGGEAMPYELAAWLFARFDEVYNSYGPTETTIFSSVHRLTGAEPVTPIGWPLPGVSMYVLDERFELVPPGVAGELVIGGRTVGHGYPNLPALTAQRFVPDPYGLPGSRMYRTGDVVRVTADGALRFLGRNDHQIKVRGFRIEAGEVEAALTECAGVAGAVVVGRTDANDDGRLIAYLVPQPGADIVLDDLRRTLRGQLPEYMVPSLFVPLDTFPLNPNGKIDRAALPAPGEVVATTYVAPDGPTQQAIARIWMELLDTARPSAVDSFFDLGGHSLTLARLAFRLREEFGVDIAFAVLFDCQTIADQALLVEQLLFDEIAQLADDEADELLRRWS